MYRKFVFRKLALFGLAMATLGIAFSQTDQLLADFSEMIVSYRQTLNRLETEVATYKRWFKNYQSQLLPEKAEVLDSTLNRQLNEIHLEIQRLEPLTNTGWLDVLSNQLDSNTLSNAPPNEIRSWIDTQNQYINQIKTDVLALSSSIEQIKQANSLLEENKVIQTSEAPETSEVSFHYPTKEDDAIEATLLYLLAGLETWGRWLEPTNQVGLLPEAEGRFMTPSTPILQTGAVPGGIGVVGFAQPIAISKSGIPDGFNADDYLYEKVLINYNDHIENVFEPVSYLDRLHYQYGVETAGRTVRIYRKPIETELTLASMLSKMGAPPEVAEIWIAEYAEVANSPQTVQLAWLIAGNPLAKDYQLHVKGVLETFDLDALLIQKSSGDFSLPQAPKTEWVNQDPFWEEVQNQPFLNAFTNLLSDASEEIKRSFIVSLFFLETTPLGTGATSRSSNVKTSSNESVSLRPKPFFWSDTATIISDTPAASSINPIIDPDQNSLVTEALKKGENLIKYWLPRQGYQVIPWSNRYQLNPNEQVTTYFIMAVTALPQLASGKQSQESYYETMLSSIVNEHLPKNQPVFKVFVGSEANDRQLVNGQGLPLRLAGNTFLWTAELDKDVIMQQAAEHHKTLASPYSIISIENGPYIAGPLTQIKKLLNNRQNYTVETLVIKERGTTRHRSKSAKNSPAISRELQVTWLSDASKLARDIFNWPLPKQDTLFIQSSGRFAHFKKSHNSNPEIKVSSMIAWQVFPLMKNY